MERPPWPLELEGWFLVQLCPYKQCYYRVIIEGPGKVLLLLQAFFCGLAVSPVEDGALGRWQCPGPEETGSAAQFPWEIPTSF